MKSRFSHRVIQVKSPLNGDCSRPSAYATKSSKSNQPDAPNRQDGDKSELKWMVLLSEALVPWSSEEEAEEGIEGLGSWKRLWRKSVEVSLGLLPFLSKQKS